MNNKLNVILSLLDYLQRLVCHVYMIITVSSTHSAVDRRCACAKQSMWNRMINGFVTVINQKK